jgi:hypothetical protein
MIRRSITKIATYFTPRQNLEAARYLAINGFVVVMSHTAAETERLREDFKQTAESFPEFRHDLPVSATSRCYTRDGFGALCFASSFHNPFVRRVRIDAHRCLAPMFRELIATEQWSPNKCLAQIMDCMLMRQAEVFGTSENWGRNINSRTLAGDRCFSGWMNLNVDNDVFICKAGTHESLHAADSQKRFRGVVDAILIAELEAVHEEVIVPPGAIIIIDETIVHMVSGVALKVEKYRVLLAWRLSSNIGSIFPTDVMASIKKQGVVTLKTGHVPPMYPLTDVMYRTDELVNWSATQLQPCVLEEVDRDAKGVVFTNQKVLVPIRFAPSLEEVGLPMYDAYASYEMDIFVARTEHELPHPDSDKMQVVCYSNE